MSYTQPPLSTTAPEIQLAGFAGDLGDYLFPGIGQAAVDAATRANETGDPRGAFVGQFPNLISPALAITTYFFPWDPISLYLSAYAIEQLLDTGQLFPSGPTNPGHEVPELSTEDTEKLADAVSTVDDNLRKVGIDVNDLDPNKVRSVQSVLDSFGATFKIQSAIDELNFARGILNPEDPDGGTSDDGTSDDGTSDDGTSDDGTSDGGTSDGGTSDGGTSDGGTSDGGTAGRATGSLTNGVAGVLRHAPQPAATG